MRQAIGAFAYCKHGNVIEKHGADELTWGSRWFTKKCWNNAKQRPLPGSRSFKVNEFDSVPY